MVTGDRRREHSKRVLVICQLDQYANGLKPRAIEQFLRKRGHDVRLVDTYYLSRASSSRSSSPTDCPFWFRHGGGTWTCYGAPSRTPSRAFGR